MEKIPCSVPILTLNCAKNLERCLESVKDFAEIIVLDGNSTDGTQEVAARFGAKVYPQVETEEKNVRISDFSEMHIKASGFTTEDWLLDLDSDEYIDDNGANEIREFVAKNDVKSAAMMPRLAIINGKPVKYSPTYPQYFIRLYNKQGGIHFKKGKAVHETYEVPPDIKICKFKNFTFTPWPPYKECLEKDRHYLYLAKNGYAKTLEEAEKFSSLMKRSVPKIVINFLQAGHFVLKTLGVYLKHGFDGAMPPKYAWRYVRYHLILSYSALAITSRIIWKKYF